MVIGSRSDRGAYAGELGVVQEPHFFVSAPWAPLCALAAAQGKEHKDIAAELNLSRGAVPRWRDRFAASGVAGIMKDAPRGGRPPKERQGLVRRIIEMTTQQKPANATHWSTRTLAKALGTNRALVNRV
jgi:transposase